MLSRTNLGLLQTLLGDRLIHVRPDRQRSSYRDAWRGYVDGIDAAFIADLLATIVRHRISQLFIDGSNFGAVAAAVKRQAPQVRIITFFHNVEARFFWGAVRTRRTAKAVAVLAANYIAERQAVHASDVLVCLSTRDSAGLHRLYGRAADAIAPMVLADVAPRGSDGHGLSRAPYALFVGGGFYANIAGIQWFDREVAPHIPLPVQVVGRGMDELKEPFAASTTTTLVGAVDDLAPWYAGATIVIAPIFDGSGMKTKVAEALMFGKHVIGTPEAFSGYATDVVAANRCCETADAFIAAIGSALTDPPPAFDPAMRSLYERDHSPDAAGARLARILGLENHASVA